MQTTNNKKEDIYFCLEKKLSKKSTQKKHLHFSSFCLHMTALYAKHAQLLEQLEECENALQSCAGEVYDHIVARCGGDVGRAVDKLRSHIVSLDREAERVEAAAVCVDDAQVSKWVRRAIRRQIAEETAESLEKRREVDEYLDRKKAQRVSPRAPPIETVVDDDASDVVDVLEDTADLIDGQPCKIFTETDDERAEDEDTDEESGSGSDEEGDGGVAVHEVDDGSVPALDIEAHLKPHQREARRLAVEALSYNRGFLIAHAMGSGKSLTLLATLKQYDKSVRAVIVCPKSMIGTWYRECFKWDVGMFVATDASGLDLWRTTGGILIVGHTALRIGHAKLGITDEVVVCVDEAHAMKNGKTALHACVESLPSKRRIFLTGTPIQNGLDNYYVLLSLLGAQEVMGMDSARSFRLFFGADIEAGIAPGASVENVMRGSMHVRLLAIALKHTMHHVASTVDTPLSDYDIVHAAPKVESDRNVINERATALRVCQTSKVQLCVGLIDAINAKHPDDCICVFSHRLAALDDLCKARPGLVYTGKHSNDREWIVANFPTETERIVYVSTTAGSEGISFVGANHVIMLDPSWNSTADAQALARCHRFGQTKKVHCYRFVARNTIEENVMEKANIKDVRRAHVLNSTMDTSQVAMVRPKRLGPVLQRVARSHDIEVYVHRAPALHQAFEQSVAQSVMFDNLYRRLYYQYQPPTQESVAPYNMKPFDTPTDHISVSVGHAANDVETQLQLSYATVGTAWEPCTVKTATKRDTHIYTVKLSMPTGTTRVVMRARFVVQGVAVAWSSANVVWQRE